MTILLFLVNLKETICGKTPFFGKPLWVGRIAVETHSKKSVLPQFPSLRHHHPLEKRQGLTPTAQISKIPLRSSKSSKISAALL
jgi:hypothetical protein